MAIGREGLAWPEEEAKRAVFGIAAGEMGGQDAKSVPSLEGWRGLKKI